METDSFYLRVVLTLTLPLGDMYAYTPADG